MSNLNEETAMEQPMPATPNGNEAALPYALLPASDTAFCLGPRAITFVRLSAAAN